MTTRVLDVPSSLLVASDSQLNGTQQDSDTRELSAFEVAQWSGALYSASAMQMYRRHVRRPVSAQGVLQFLLNDEQLPSAYRFCLLRLDRCLNAFTNVEPVRSVVQSQLQQLQNADIGSLATDAAKRHQFLDDLQLGLIGTHNAIASAYFPPVLETA